MADDLADGVGAALVEVSAGVGARPVDAGGVLGAVVVEVAAVLALVVLADLAERAVGVSLASGEADPVAVRLAGLLAVLAGEAVGVVEADLDADLVDAALAQGTLVVDGAAGQAVVVDAGGTGKAGSAVRRVTPLGGSDAAVGRIRKTFSRDSSESGRTRANVVHPVGRFTHGIGAAGISKGARVVLAVGILRQGRHKERLCRFLRTLSSRRPHSRPRS